MSQRTRDAGFPDIERIGEDRYRVTIPIGSDPDDRGAAHDGGTISLYLNGSQMNEWINRLSETLKGESVDA